jgi:probable rRNA maturation factor
VPAPPWVGRWVHATVRSANAALDSTLVHGDAHVCVRIVAPGESQRLNRTFRGKDKPTNVLSFPASVDERRFAGSIGDIVVCAAVVAAEARAQDKTLPAHWAHMVVHGTLHLLGHDHVKRRDARRMERLEVEILRGFGYQDPYRTRPTPLHE